MIIRRILSDAWKRLGNYLSGTITGAADAAAGASRKTSSIPARHATNTLEHKDHELRKIVDAAGNLRASWSGRTGSVVRPRAVRSTGECHGGACVRSRHSADYVVYIMLIIGIFLEGFAWGSDLCCAASSGVIPDNDRSRARPGFGLARADGVESGILLQPQRTEPDYVNYRPASGLGCGSHLGYICPNSVPGPTKRRSDQRRRARCPPVEGSPGSTVTFVRHPLPQTLSPSPPHRMPEFVTVTIMSGWSYATVATVWRRLMRSQSCQSHRNLGARWSVGSRWSVDCCRAYGPATRTL